MAFRSLLSLIEKSIPTTGTKSPLGLGTGTSLNSVRLFGGKPNCWLTESPNQPRQNWVAKVLRLGLFE
jgi:hypothetical protein